MKPERKKKAYNIKGLAVQGLAVAGGRRMDFRQADNFIK